MIFAIRDDDTNYFTKPEELASCYDKIWQTCPVSISVVPFMKGNWPNWIHQLEHTKGNINWTEWEKDNQPYRIGDNVSLVTYLKEKIKEEKVSITIHGIHHRNEDLNKPSVKNNYSHGAEFFTERDLTASLSEAIEYLESIFQVKIKVFTPPQNLLSEKGRTAVINNRLSINTDTPSPGTMIALHGGIVNFLKRSIYKARYSKNNYPYVFHYKDHNEVNHYRLQPGTRIEQLTKAFDFVYEKQGVFVLSTHYYAFSYHMLYDHKVLMSDVFNEFMQYVVSHPGIEYRTLNNILGNGK